jgi:hypothetical protein
MRKRLPEFYSIVQVYAVIAVMFAGWTITAFLWKLSAWLLFLNLGEIFTIFSYAMAVSFLESLISLLILLIACAIFPAPSLRNDFVVRGMILSIGLIGSLMALVGSQMQFGMESGLLVLIAPLAVLMLMTFFLYRSLEYHRMRSAAMWLSDRVTIFLFLLLPVFAVLSVYVMFRNLL